MNYGRVGQTEIPDHVAALRQAAATRPYMDLDRAGIHGGSWGGYFALRGMLMAPEFFKAGYAGAPGALETAVERCLSLPARFRDRVREAGALELREKVHRSAHPVGGIISSTATQVCCSCNAHARGAANGCAYG